MSRVLAAQANSRSDVKVHSTGRSHKPPGEAQRAIKVRGR
jgi:hypothetical protein